MKFLMTCVIAAGLSLSACSDASAPQEGASDIIETAPVETALVETPPVTGAYMIVRGKNYEAKELGPYAASLPPIYAKYGGRYVSFTTDFVTLEGQDDSQAVIMSAWPSVDAAQTFWDSPEYRDAIKLREGIGDFTVVILPALPSR